MDKIIIEHSLKFSHQSAFTLVVIESVIINGSVTFESY